MPLTDAEARRLERLAAELRRTDPELAHALSSGRLPVERTGRRRRRVTTVVVTGTALGLLGVGIAVQVPAVCMAGWFTLLGVLVARGISG